MVSVSMLSSYTFCPRSFYLSYVLKVSRPPRSVMVLGSIKHKIYELIQKSEKEFISSINSKEDILKIPDKYKDRLLTLTRETIIKNKFILRNVEIPLSEAFGKIWPIFFSEAKHRTNTLQNFQKESNLLGAELWLNLTPKIKSEYRLKSDSLQINGIIDQLEIHPGKLIPIELKSGSMPELGVWPGHKVQIAAYMLLLEDLFKTPIQTGVVRYIDKTEDRIITMNPQLKEEIINLRDDVLKTLDSKDLPPILIEDNRCKGCGLSEVCNNYGNAC